MTSKKLKFIEKNLFFLLFSMIGGVNLSAEPAQTGEIRFSLRIENSATDSEDIDSPDHLNIYGDSQGISIVSSSFDPVQHVAIYDSQGKVVFESPVEEKYYPLPENVEHSTLIVKARTKDWTKIEKLTISK